MAISNKEHTKVRGADSSNKLIDVGKMSADDIEQLMYLRDEARPSPHLRQTAVALSPLYKLLPPTRGSALSSAIACSGRSSSDIEGVPSMYEEIRGHFIALGVNVQDEPEPGVPWILMLCEGFFENQQLVEETLGRLASVNTRQSGFQGLSPLRRPLQRLNTFINKQIVETRSAPDATARLHFHSTSYQFSEYISRCPPVLREAGLLKNMFAKWCVSPQMQRAAALEAASALPAVVPERGSGLSPGSSNSKLSVWIGGRMGTIGRSPGSPDRKLTAWLGGSRRRHKQRTQEDDGEFTWEEPPTLEQSAGWRSQDKCRSCSFITTGSSCRDEMLARTSSQTRSYHQPITRIRRRLLTPHLSSLPAANTTQTCPWNSGWRTRRARTA